MIFIRWPFLCSLKHIDVDDQNVNYQEFLNRVSNFSGIPEDHLQVYSSHRRLLPNDVISPNSTVDIVFSLPGGKGGFGSMLRAIGAQIEKTTNREACRDLSGRRLRDINEEQRLKKWLAKKVERERESERRLKERIERLKQQPKHNFDDLEYNKQRSELPERIDDALSEGLKKKSKHKPGKGKRHSVGDAAGTSKRLCLWGEKDIPSSSDGDEDGSLSGDSSENTPKSDTNSDTSPEADQQLSENSQTVSSLDAKIPSDQENLQSDDSVTNSLLETAAAKSSACGCETAEGTITETSTSGAEIAENAKETAKNETATIDSSTEISTSEDVDLMKFESVDELQDLGLEKLKLILVDMRLKCGGTLTERAQRLWTVRGLDEKDFPPSLRAKGKKK